MSIYQVLYIIGILILAGGLYIIYYYILWGDFSGFQPLVFQAVVVVFRFNRTMDFRKLFGSQCVIACGDPFSQDLPYLIGFCSWKFWSRSFVCNLMLLPTGII